MDGTVARELAGTESSRNPRERAGPIGAERIISPRENTSTGASHVRKLDRTRFSATTKINRLVSVYHIGPIFMTTTNCELEASF
jgi:hypothetical protein